MRILAGHHIYREITPDVFTNTRISSMLDTLKPSKEVIAEYVDTLLSFQAFTPSIVVLNTNTITLSA